MGVQAGARHPGPKDLEHIFLIYRIVPSARNGCCQVICLFPLCNPGGTAVGVLAQDVTHG